MKTKTTLSLSVTALPGKIEKLAVLAMVCGGSLLPAANLRADQAVPFKDHGYMTIVANLQDVFLAANGDLMVSAVDQETGEATDLGLYNNTADALHDITTDWTWGTGRYTAANGDTLNYTFVQPPNSPTTVTFNGGTGQFAHATGSATAQGSNITVVQEGTLLIITQDLTTVVTISF